MKKGYHLLMITVCTTIIKIVKKYHNILEKRLIHPLINLNKLRIHKNDEDHKNL
jgi:hypothetical protein